MHDWMLDNCSNIDDLAHYRYLLLDVKNNLYFYNRNYLPKIQLYYHFYLDTKRKSDALLTKGDSVLQKIIERINTSLCNTELTTQSHTVHNSQC